MPPAMPLLDAGGGSFSGDEVGSAVEAAEVPPLLAVRTLWLRVGGVATGIGTRIGEFVTDVPLPRRRRRGLGLLPPPPAAAAAPPVPWSAATPSTADAVAVGALRSAGFAAVGLRPVGRRRTLVLLPGRAVCARMPCAAPAAWLCASTARVCGESFLPSEGAAPS